MSSYFRPDPFGAVFLRLAGTDRDVRRPELFFPKKNPSISHYAPALRERRHSKNHLSICQYTILSADLQLFAPRTGRVPRQAS